MTKDTSLAPLTTLGVGGDADRLLKLSNETELIEALQDAETQNVRTYILGGGSNIVFDDGGFEGWVLRPEQCALRFDAHGEDVKVYAEAGLPWDALVHACVEQGLAGVEAMSGIPGHVGAAPIQNIGAYGQELSNSLTSVRAYDRANKKIVQLSNDACQFEYRSSIFKRHGAGAYVILSVELTLRLSTGELPLRYHDLHQYFDGDTAPSVKALRDAVLAIRRSKGMVYSPDDPDSHSVGSFFLNPVVDADQRQELQAKAAAKGWTLPSYPQADGRHKVSAAWLIERAGVQRGERLGSAGISSKHVLALMNPGRATSADIRALARHVQERVAQAWGISLTPEVRILSSTGLDPSFYPAPLERSCPPTLR